MSWRHPYQRTQLLSPQGSASSVADLKQEEAESPLQKPAVTVTAGPISIATTTTTQLAHSTPTALTPGSSSPLSEHAASLTFPSLSESGSEEVGASKDSLGERPPQAEDGTQLASQQQELTKGIGQKQTSVLPASNNLLPMRLSDHGELSRLGRQEEEEEEEEPVSAQDEGSLTLTEISDGEEEIEEELTEVSEDTVFEETLPTTGK